MIKDKRPRPPAKLRSSIESLPSDFRSPEDSLCLSESCNFAERASLAAGDRMFKKGRHPFSQSTTLVPYAENSSPNNPIRIQEHSFLCQNHDTKPAQFRVLTEGDTMFYCERCAISLASQGFNVCRMDGVALPDKKPIEVEFLLDHVDLLRETMGKKMEQLRKQHGASRTIIEAAEESIEGFYAEVTRIVQ